MDKVQKLKNGIKSGYDGLVFRPSDKYEYLNDVAIAECGGPGFIDGWYVCIQWKDGSRFPYPLAVLDPRDDEDVSQAQAEAILEAQELGFFDEAHADIARSGVRAGCYIKKECRDEVLYPPCRLFFQLDDN